MQGLQKGDPLATVPVRASDPRNGVCDLRKDGEQAVETGDAEYLQQVGIVHHKPEVSGLGRRLPQSAHQHSKRRRVYEMHLREIENNPLTALHRCRKRFLQSWSGIDVEITADMDDGSSVYNVCADRKIHAPPPVVKDVSMATPMSGSHPLLPSIRQSASMQTQRHRCRERTTGWWMQSWWPWKPCRRWSSSPPRR